jgi:cytoskeletal protein RodZ
MHIVRFSLYLVTVTINNVVDIPDPLSNVGAGAVHQAIEETAEYSTDTGGSSGDLESPRSDDTQTVSETCNLQLEFRHDCW